MKKTISLVVLLMLTASLCANAESLVRIQCEEEDLGTEVFINGKFVGECPVDAQVPAGTAVLRARKKMTNEDYETVFEKKLRLGEGTAQRVELIMSAPQLTAAAKARKEADEAAALLKEAEAGDVAAMGRIAEHYESGLGVKKDAAAAARWRNKAESTQVQNEMAAAKAGDIKAMQSIAARYEKGLGVEKDLKQGQIWRDAAAAATRQKAVQEAEETRRKAAQDEAARKAREAAARSAERAHKINSFSFFQTSEKLLNNSEVKDNVTEVLLTWMPTAIIGLALDLISSPTRSTELHMLKNEAALRPSTWGKSDSMVAKASRQLKGETHQAAVGGRSLVAAR